jgi:hypothetical protein
MKALAVLHETGTDLPGGPTLARRGRWVLAAGGDKGAGQFGRGRNMGAAILVAVINRDWTFGQGWEVFRHGTGSADSAALPVAARIGNERHDFAAAAER